MPNIAGENRKKRRGGSSKGDKNKKGKKKGKAGAPRKRKRSRKKDKATKVKAAKIQPKAIQADPVNGLVTVRTMPDYDRYPREVLIKGKSQRNHAAGCGPDRVLVDGMCERNFTRRDLEIICPKIRPRSSVTLQSHFSTVELQMLTDECGRLHEQLMDEAQSMEAQTIPIYEALKAMFKAAPGLLVTKVFTDFFSPIKHYARSVSSTHVSISKRGSSIIKKIPFAALAGKLGSAASSTIKFLGATGATAAAWVYNSPQAQRFIMHLAKMVKHSMCTVFGRLKDRGEMGWKDWGKEKYVYAKTDIFQLLSANSGMISGGITAALGVAGGPLGLGVSSGVTLMSQYVIKNLANSGRLQDFMQTFVTGCKQFEYGMSQDNVSQYFLQAGIGTYAPYLIKFFKTFDPQTIMSLTKLVGL